MKFHSKMIKTRPIILLVVIALAIPFNSYGQDNDKLPSRPNPPRLVNDLANVIDAGSEERLEAKLTAYNDSTSTQIAVITLASVEPYDVSEYAYKLGRYWGVGQKDFNNGIVLLVAVNDHRMFIATGYGTEAYLTDIRSKRIIDGILTPAFRQNDYYGGIDSATTEIMKFMTGAYEGEPYGASPDGPNMWFVIIIVIIVIALFSRNKKGGGGTTFTGRGPTYMGGGGFGGFGGGGGGGGGFGGFGGGGFGGGGAGGSW